VQTPEPEAENHTHLQRY